VTSLWPYISRSGSSTRIIGAANHFGDDQYLAKTLEAVSEVAVARLTEEELLCRWHVSRRVSKYVRPTANSSAGSTGSLKDISLPLAELRGFEPLIVAGQAPSAVCHLEVPARAQSKSTCDLMVPGHAFQPGFYTASVASRLPVCKLGYEPVSDAIKAPPPGGLGARRSFVVD
jgi:hypothetical protein